MHHQLICQRVYNGQVSNGTDQSHHCLFADDPITAAIMRSAESYTETKSPDKAGLEGELAIIPRASSFTSGGTLSSPITPGRKESRKILRVAAAAAGGAVSCSK